MAFTRGWMGWYTLGCMLGKGASLLQPSRLELETSHFHFQKRGRPLLRLKGFVTRATALLNQYPYIPGHHVSLPLVHGDSIIVTGLRVALKDAGGRAPRNGIPRGPILGRPGPRLGAVGWAVVKMECRVSLSLQIEFSRLKCCKAFELVARTFVHVGKHRGPVIWSLISRHL